MAWIWVILSALVFLHLLQKLLTHNKKMPPGPTGLPILGHLHLLGKNPHHVLRDLAKKYGPIMGMRFGFMPVVVVSSPAAAELILKTHDGIFSSRPSQAAFEYLSYGQKNLAFSPYGPYWRDMKKLCTLELLSMKRIHQFLPMREAEIRLLVESLKLAAERGEGVDLSTKLLILTRDMNFQMLFGRKFDKEGGMDREGFKRVLVETSELGGKFNIADYFPILSRLDLQGINRKMEDTMKMFDAFLEKIIDDHTKDPCDDMKQNEDFVDTMMAILKSGNAAVKFDRSHVKAILLDLMIAGTDTSSNVAEWALSELVKNPTIMKKLQKELESVVGMDNMVDQSHLEKLEYLHLVIKESMRLHPVAPMLLPHESMEDSVIEGFHIPKKTRILVNTWAIMRDPKVWSDPETFFPDRFIGSSRDVHGQDFELLPFGSGRRSCPGRQLGLIVVKLIVAQLVHCFDWELSDNKKPSDMDMTELFGIVSSRAEHLVAIPTTRLLK